MVGSIPNNFPKAAAKINAINLKHGPFEFCLITGTLNIDTDAKLDLTTYSLGDHKNLDNLVSLGDNGILKTANGTTIATIFILKITNSTKQKSIFCWPRIGLWESWTTLKIISKLKAVNSCRKYQRFWLRATISVQKTLNFMNESHTRTIMVLLLDSFLLGVMVTKWNIDGSMLWIWDRESQRPNSRNHHF